jgi:hypothetical protein
MADEKISGRVGLDTTEFKTNIAAMNRELRVLESGWRAAAAGLSDWASDATGLESRIKSLNSQIDIQKTKVAAVRAEYERVAAEKGNTSRAAQDLEIKLNKETETLGKMQSELGETETALGELGSEADETGSDMEEMGTKSEGLNSMMAGLSSGIGIAVGVLVAVAAAAIAAGVAIGALVFSSANAAADLVDLSAKTGISTTRLQELSYIGKQIGIDLDSVARSNARLTRAMGEAVNKKSDQAKAFKLLGVSIKDADGNLRDSQDVFNDTIDALGLIENPAQRDIIAMQLFGKSAMELNPLIKAGSTELARLADQAHNVGAVMDEDAVAGLEAFDDTMASMKDGLKGTLGTLSAEFLPVFQLVADTLQELFSSPEFKAGLQEFSRVLSDVVVVTVDVLKDLLSGNVSGALTTLFGADNSAMLLDFFEQIRSFIQDTLIPFVTVHAEEIKAALIGIGAALAAAGIISLIVGIVAAINPVTLIIAAIVAAVGLLAAAWTGDWGGIRTTMTEIWDGYLKPAFEQLVAWFSVNIPLALQFLSDLWTGTLLPAIQTVWAFLNTSVFPLFAALGELIGVVLTLALTAMAGIWQNVLQPALQTVWAFLQDNIFPIFQAIGEYIAVTLQPVFDTLSSFLTKNLTPAFDGISKAIGKVVDWIKDLTKKLKEIKLPAWMTPGSPTPWEVGLVGISDAMADLNKQIPQLQMSLGGAVLGLNGNLSVGGAGSGVVNNNNNSRSYQYAIQNAGIDAEELVRIQRREEMLYGA